MESWGEKEETAAQSRAAEEAGGGYGAGGIVFGGQDGLIRGGCVVGVLEVGEEFGDGTALIFGGGAETRFVNVADFEGDGLEERESI